MYTNEERETAQALVKNKPALELLAKIMLKTEDKLALEVLLDKNDKELAELVRSDALAEQKIKTRFSELKRIGTVLKGNGTPAAPE